MQFHPEVFVKSFKENLATRDFQYKLGLNTNIHPFFINTECVEGGFSYTDIDNLLGSICFTPMIGIVRIPLDIPFIKTGNKYRSSIIFIENVYTYDEFVENKDIYPEAKKLVKDPVLKLRLIEQTPEICLATVKNNGMALEFVKEQTPEICLAAVKQNVWALEFVKKQTPEICLAAVKQNGRSLEFVKEQTPEICLEAVKQDGMNLEFVKKQTPKICLAAVKRNGRALEFVKKQTPEICLEAVKKNGENLEFVKELTPEICLMAMEKYVCRLKYVKDRT